MIDLNPSRNLAVRRRADCLFGVFLLPVLAAGLGLIGAGRVTAQTFTVLHSFTTISFIGFPNSDGANPAAGLLLSGNTLYGTAEYGGSSGWGTVFAVNADGTGFTNLHSFTAFDPTYGTNSDGILPSAGLILSSNTLYGAAYGGGSGGNGTVSPSKPMGPGLGHYIVSGRLSASILTVSPSTATELIRLPV